MELCIQIKYVHSFGEKAEILKAILENPGSSYADSFKTDLIFYFGDFGPEDARLAFLHKLESQEQN